MSFLSPKVLTVFLCAADQDQDLYKKLEKHLFLLNERGWIACWSNQQIEPGKPHAQEIALRCQTTDLFLLLISPDFYASQECRETMQKALQRAANGSAAVIPVLLRPFDYEGAEFRALQVLPRNRRPITSWTSRDKAFEQIAAEIRMVVEALRRQVIIVSCLPDQTFTGRLAHDLTTHGISLGMEANTLEPTTLKDRIREASVVVVLASPETWYAHTLELENVRRLSNMYQRPIVGVLVSNEKRDDRLPDSQQQNELEWIVVDSRQEESAFQRIRAALNRKWFHSIYIPPGEPEPSQEPRNPYKGLHAFTADDTRDFFGRERLIQDLINILQDMLEREKQGLLGPRLLTIVGPSGSGKSSIAMAGLLPHLQEGVISGSHSWIYPVPVVPGAYPLEALALAFAAYFPMRSTVALQEDLEAKTGRGLHVLARQIAPQPGRKVVLLIDQFEELFTQTTSEEERRDFVELVVRAVSEPSGPVVVILILRADFYDRPMSYPELSRLIQEHMMQVLPMETQELRAVIEKPAMLPDVQLTFEGDLVGDLLYEMWGQAGALPLLQFTLEQLFNLRNGHTLTVHAYQELGGIKGALTKHAESTYNALRSEEQRKLACALFIRLINFGATEQDTTRRRASFSEFLLSDSLQTHLLDETIGAFIKARLLTSSKVSGTTTLEISHEALIREWPRLSNWLHKAREDIRLQHIISEDVTEWKQRDMPKDRLYRGSQLSEAQTWAARNIPSQDEVQFLQESAQEQEQQILRERNQLARELSLQRRASRRQKYVIGLSVVVSLVIIIGLVISLYQQNLLLVSRPASVTNMNDHGDGSLRDAILHAPGGGLITFARNIQGTIVLNGGEIQITRDLTISGPGVSDLSISGNGKSRVFNVGKGHRLTIIGLTIENGYADSNYGGACILNGGDSSLELIHSKVTHCKSVGRNGGSIANWSGTLVLTSCVISENAGTFGGGIDNANGTLTITNSTISQNTAEYGGGIFHSGVGMLTLLASTISDNTAKENGGGIQSAMGSFVITQSTISENTALRGLGGGIFTIEGVSAGTLNSLFYTTIYQNRANAGGGLYVSTPLEGFSKNLPSAKVDMTTSIVAGNTAQEGSDIWGPLYVSGANLVQSVDSRTNLHIAEADLSDSHATTDARTQYTQEHLITGKSPDLGPLNDNQGPTKTHALGLGSPAHDAIMADVTSLCKEGTRYSFSIGGMVVNLKIR